MYVPGSKGNVVCKYDAPKDLAEVLYNWLQEQSQKCKCKIKKIKKRPKKEPHVKLTVIEGGKR